MSGPLAPSDLDVLGQACERARLALEVHRGDGAASMRDDLLAVFSSAAETPVIGPAEVRAWGAHAVLVQQEPSAGSMLGAISAGYSFVLASPLGADRLASFLGYLARVAAPGRAKVLRLDDTGVLSTPSASVGLDDAQAAVLRLFARSHDRIVAREEIATETRGEDPLGVVSALGRKFEEIGSGAQILKVPHMGFRLAGRVRTAGP